ncbi:MAG: DegT/DnrJ/EryC1/StrS family aminotransferase [Tannerella sp.]|jgi:dTDP-4-amino-4,6-dideoxygalactose transaminase|nr:DegT/DnrJ/EryC1/StrS family aminotransferase [Tannerella sp.]
MQIPMTDLGRQYLRLKPEIDVALQDVFLKSNFINGEAVKIFCNRLSEYLDVRHVIPCGNATDGLRIALQALGAGPESDVIVPAFTYISPVEAIASLGASPVVVDVEPDTFNINPELIERAITIRTKAIVLVHLFGQACNFEAIQKIAGKYNLFIIEDNAQSFGASYEFSDGRKRKLGTLGDIGVTSFFPTKPLACYGDGGAIFISDTALAEKVRMLANHGQSTKYHHKIIGYNSRLDTLQAAILNVKLSHLEKFTERRVEIAGRYDRAFKDFPDLAVPVKRPYSDHVYHQYTIRVKNGKRDALRNYLSENGIASMIYYPLPVHEQEAYKWVARVAGDLRESVCLCNEALSLPIHSEMTDETQKQITETIRAFFSRLNQSI